MRAAGFRPATPALAKMLEIGTDHACDAVGQHTPVGLRSPQSLLLSSTIDATGRCSQNLPGRHQASNRHRARCARVLSLPRLRALQVCRRRPTLGVAAVPHGRHPQTFTKADVGEGRFGNGRWKHRYCAFSLRQTASRPNDIALPRTIRLRSQQQWRKSREREKGSRTPADNAMAIPNLWFRTVDRNQGFESWSALFLRENGRGEQNHVHEGNERHCDIVCRQVQ